MQEESKFKILYRCNRTIERHTNSPLADWRRRYLEHRRAFGVHSKKPNADPSLRSLRLRSGQVG